MNRLLRNGLVVAAGTAAGLGIGYELSDKFISHNTPEVQANTSFSRGAGESAYTSVSEMRDNLNWLIALPAGACGLLGSCVVVLKAEDL